MAQINIAGNDYWGACCAGIFSIPGSFAGHYVPCVRTVPYEHKSVGAKIRAKRTKIEYELPRLVFTVEITLKHSRDVLYMLESYTAYERVQSAIGCRSRFRCRPMFKGVGPFRIMLTVSCHKVRYIKKY